MIVKDERLYVELNVSCISGIVISMFNTTETTFTKATNVNEQSSQL